MTGSYKIDYKNNIFDHPELTRIHGKPTTATLLTLKNEVKANTQSVHSTLSGGKYRHLGLVCDATAYSVIHDTTPYLHPALIQQIVTAIEPKYINAIQYSFTNWITRTTPKIFDHLFDNYGSITPEELRELKIQVEGLTYSPAEPVDIIFTKIEDLADATELAKNPITKVQKIDYAYLLL
eukprot:731961-Ditylum_brightwellii.AAC.1